MNDNRIGARIKEIRERKGFTQETFAARMGLSTTYISTIERGLKLPKLDTFIRMANVLEVSADELLVDVVNESTVEKTIDFSRILDGMPEEKREKIIAVIQILMD